MAIIDRTKSMSQWNKLKLHPRLVIVMCPLCRTERGSDDVNIKRAARYDFAKL